jgi:hypothetical protein
MNNREFAAMAKRHAVDEVADEVVDNLENPRLTPHRQVDPGDLIGQSIQKWIDRHSQIKQRRSEWFHRLTNDDQETLREILKDCAEKAVGNLFCLIDGVGGAYEGVFEIVAVDSDSRRHVLNPQSDDMLHDIFSEVCEKNRTKGGRRAPKSKP